MRMRVAIVLLCALPVAACGGGDEGSDPASSTTSSTAVATPVPTLGAVPDIGAGQDAALVFLADLPGERIALDVTSCTIDPGAEPDGEVPAELLAAAATGTMSDGTEVNLDVRRFRSQGASPTITDTVTLVFGDPDAPERALVAQRFEVDGLVNDLRDPAADDPLLVVGPGGFEGRGLFAPPGGGADDPDRVEGLVRASCA